MPIGWLMDYWEAKVEATLPFLAGRATAMQLVYGGRAVFRRHNADGSFVFVDTREELLKWARQHCYSFHPHLDNGVLCFALDIDRRSDAMPLELAQLAASEVSAALDALSVRYLLKFSGNRGFHFLWGFRPEDVQHQSQGDIWSFERRIIRYLREVLEVRLQQHPRHEEFRHAVPEGQPITVTNSVDKGHADSLLLDENIVHPLGSLRSPWSIHPETGLVSLPIDPGELAAFSVEAARPRAVLARGAPVEIPINAAAPFVPLIAGL